MSFLIIALAYVLCHGATAMLVTPLQSKFLPHETIFASLMYLPHGVRVLATWAFGWKAIPPLIAGTVLSVWLFTPSAELDFLSPALLESILVGSMSAFIAFELARLSGYPLYAGRSRKLSWVGMIAIGAFASIINSTGQTLIYSGLIGIDDIVQVLVIYAIGDVVGVVACMAVLMLVFRWSRALGAMRSSENNRDGQS